MNLTTYQTLLEKVGIENLNDAHKDAFTIVKDGSNNFTDPALWNEMIADADIRQAYELHVKALQKMADKPKTETSPKREAPSKVKPTAKSKKPAKVKPALAPAPIIEKEAKPKAKKQTMPKEKKAVNANRTKRSKNKKPPTPPRKVASAIKYPVTIKRFSKELQLIKRFLNMDSKKKSVKSIQNFHRELSRILETRPDRKPVLREIHERLGKTLRIAESNVLTGVVMNIDKAFKEKLVQHLQSAQPKLKVEYLAGVAHGQKKSSPPSKLSGLPSLTLAKNDSLFQHINSIDEQTKDTFRLPGALGKFLGDLEVYKLAITIEGDQGAGKTQLAFQLADGFADIGKSVGMFQLEIGANSNIVRRNRDKYIKQANRDRIKIAGEAPAGIDTIRDYARKFGVIIIDSWTKLDVDSAEFDKLRNDFPDTIWIVLFQRTTAKSIRGGTKPLYDAGINLDVVKADETFINNYAVATKNRYGQTGLHYNISSQKIEK